MFKFETVNNKKILKSTLLTKAEHLFTTRDSVVTYRDLEQLIPECRKNLQILADYLNITVNDFITPVQTHSANIQTAQKGHKYENTDALVIKDNDIAIVLNFADCTPVILYDELNNVGAISHAGWRGTAASIVPKTIEFMHKEFGTKPQNITAIIGPAISLNNYQVDEEVFKQVTATLSKEYSDYYLYNAVIHKYNIDLKTVNYHQLKELGVKRIDKCEYCTYDSVDVFFSYRRENGITARHSAILKLK